MLHTQALAQPFEPGLLKRQAQTQYHRWSVQVLATATMTQESVTACLALKATPVNAVRVRAPCCRVPNAHSILTPNPTTLVMLQQPAQTAASTGADAPL